MIHRARKDAEIVDITLQFCCKQETSTISMHTMQCLNYNF